MDSSMRASGDRAISRPAIDDDLERQQARNGASTSSLANRNGAAGHSNANRSLVIEAEKQNRSAYTRMKKAKAEIRRITLHFTPSWFSVNMGTGITSILLHQLPYQFRGLGIISNVIFGLNVVLFLLFTCISIARYTIWPNLFWTMLFHPTQSLFLGTFAMGFATIVSMCAISAAPAFGSAFITFTWILWWFDAIISIVVCIGLPFLQFTRHEQSLDKVTGVWFLPVVSTIVAAASGGIVAEILPPAHARLTLTISWILWGTGFPLAILLMALYYGRLAIYKIPPATLIVSAFLPLGPCGQGAFALLQISSVLYRLSKSTNQGLGSSSTMDGESMATAIYAVSIPIALVIWGLGLVWLVLAIAFLIDLAIVQELNFNLGWWGFTFPLGVFCTATTQLGRELDSGAFRILGTILSLIEVALWFFIALKTTMGAISGKLFFSPCLAEQGGEPPKSVHPARKYSYQERSRSPRNSSRSGIKGSISRSLSRARSLHGRGRDDSRTR